MPLVTILWSMISAACLTLAGVHGLIWWNDRTKRDRLAFAVLSLAGGAMSLLELAMMKSGTPDSFARALRWQHVTILGLFIGILSLVRLRLGAGRLWLGGLAVALRAVSLVLNFTVGVSMNYLSVSGMRETRFLGDVVWVPEAVPNFSMLVGQAALLLLVWFVADASVTAWRRGERQRTLVTGGSVLAFVFLGSAQGILSHWKVVDVPAVAGHWSTGLIFVMAMELALDGRRNVRLEQELRETQERERREVAHLGRVAALGDMSASLAHEMNQPLGTILTNAEAARRLLARDQPDLVEVRAILDDIVSEDLRAAAVIQRLRAMLKRGEVRFEPVSLNEVVQDVAPLVRRLLSGKEVELTKTYADRLPAVSGDRIQLQQVLLNLILNACEAMESTPPGQRRLRVSTSSADGRVALSVEDSGSGLPADAEVLFQPFYTTKEQGLGMGLSICHSIVAAHQGHLRATPAPGGGAVFCMSLPVMPGS